MTIKYEELLYYSEDSKTGLRWKVDRSTPNGGVIKRIDTDAGCFVRGKKQEKKCININFNGSVRKVHRIIWELLVEPIPAGMVIDHLDGNPWNNKIENLFCKTQKQNCQNAVRDTMSNTGIKGVRLTLMNGGNNAYIEARVYLGGDDDKSYQSARFSLDEFRYKAALEKAIEWRNAKLQEANGQGERYTDRHILNGPK